MARKSSNLVGDLTLGGVEYVIIPKAEYLVLRDALPEGTVDAHALIRSSIGADLRAAREAAGMTQSELAQRMGKSQTLVSQAESGDARVSERYVRSVLKACGLPADWNGKPGAAPKKRAVGKRRSGRKRPSGHSSEGT